MYSTHIYYERIIQYYHFFLLQSTALSFLGFPYSWYYKLRLVEHKVFLAHYLMNLLLLLTTTLSLSYYPLLQITSASARSKDAGFPGQLYSYKITMSTNWMWGVCVGVRGGSRLGKKGCRQTPTVLTQRVVIFHK